MRPNIRPGDMPIDEAYFNAAFGWILEPYTHARDAQVRREREAGEAAKRGSVKASADALETDRATKGGVPVEAAPLADADELKAKLAELERHLSAQQESFRRLDQITGGE